MFNKHLARQRSNEPHQLDITPFLNLMVALVPFLLVTAVFSRVAILELNLPSTQQVESNDEEQLIIEIIVREDKLELSDGKKVLSTYKKTDDDYDLAGLSEALARLKEKNPQKTDASILLERKIQYDYLVQVMDTVRASRVEDDETEEEDTKRVTLFPDISIGDAP
ncbi:MAG: biopolymer transporter ExbD [Thiotrichales bacterium]|nr:MAG: biopolymer transporter ExbD [Thiotrichales bacterium]